MNELVQYFIALGHTPESAIQYATQLIGPVVSRQVELGPAEVTPMHPEVDLEVTSVEPAGTSRDYRGAVGAGRVLHAFGYPENEAERVVKGSVRFETAMSALPRFLQGRYGMDAESARMYARKLIEDDPKGEFVMTPLQPVTGGPPELPWEAAQRLTYSRYYGGGFADQANQAANEAANDFRKWMTLEAVK